LVPKVQELFNAKWLSFKESGLIVRNNLLPGHGNTLVNVVKDGVKDVENSNEEAGLMFDD